MNWQVQVWPWVLAMVTVPPCLYDDLVGAGVAVLVPVVDFPQAAVSRLNAVTTTSAVLRLILCPF